MHRSNENAAMPTMEAGEELDAGFIQLDATFLQLRLQVLRAGYRWCPHEFWGDFTGVVTVRLDVLAASPDADNSKTRGP